MKKSLPTISKKKKFPASIHDQQQTARKVAL